MLVKEGVCKVTTSKVEHDLWLQLQHPEPGVCLIVPIPCVGLSLDEILEACLHQVKLKDEVGRDQHYQNNGQKATDEGALP